MNNTIKHGTSPTTNLDGSRYQHGTSEQLPSQRRVPGAELLGTVPENCTQNINALFQPSSQGTGSDRAAESRYVLDPPSLTHFDSLLFRDRCSMHGLSNLTAAICQVDDRERSRGLLAFARAYLHSGDSENKAPLKDVDDFLYDASRALPEQEKVKLYLGLSAIVHSPCIAKTHDALLNDTIAFSTPNQKKIYGLLAPNLNSLPEGLRLKAAECVIAQFATGNAKDMLVLTDFLRKLDSFPDNQLREIYDHFMNHTQTLRNELRSVVLQEFRKFMRTSLDTLKMDIDIEMDERRRKLAEVIKLLSPTIATLVEPNVGARLNQYRTDIARAAQDGDILKRSWIEGKIASAREFFGNEHTITVLRALKAAVDAAKPSAFVGGSPQKKDMLDKIGKGQVKGKLIQNKKAVMERLTTVLAATVSERDE